MKRILFPLLLAAVIGALAGAGMPIDPAAREEVKADLLKKFGPEAKFRIERGVEQAAALCAMRTARPRNSRRFAWEISSPMPPRCKK